MSELLISPSLMGILGDEVEQPKSTEKMHLDIIIRTGDANVSITGSFLQFEEKIDASCFTVSLLLSDAKSVEAALKVIDISMVEILINDISQSSRVIQSGSSVSKKLTMTDVGPVLTIDVISKYHA
jgi:hypothetical protein